jgi:hypothetical protein
MKLTEAHVDRVWQWMIEAEVRSYYFGELASRDTKKKQIITGLSFFLSSGAAATLAAKLYWAPLILASIAAVLTAYSVAVGLDKRAIAMAKLHHQWNVLSADYERLWHHWYEDDAEERLDEILRRDREASQTGTVEAPYDESLIDKWQDRVNILRGLAA